MILQEGKLYEIQKGLVWPRLWPGELVLITKLEYTNSHVREYRLEVLHAGQFKRFDLFVHRAVDYLKKLG